MAGVIWYPGESLSTKMRIQVEKACRREGIGAVHIIDMFIRGIRYAERKGKLKKRVGIKSARAELETVMMEDAERSGAKAIITSDDAIVQVMFDAKSASAARGSIYFLPSGVPVVIVERELNMFRRNYGQWQFAKDIGKAATFVRGKPVEVPKFEYTVTFTEEHLDQLDQFALGAFAMGVDIETAGWPTFITSVQLTIMRHDGRLHTFVIPFYNHFNEGNAHWETEELECKAWLLLRKILHAKSYKALQNGKYDIAHLSKYGIYPVGWIFDTKHMMHAMWVDTPRRLDYIASVLHPYYQYWKDDIKGDASDKKETSRSKVRIPRSARGLSLYWRYGGLDTHYTLLCAMYLALHLVKSQYGLHNYKQSFFGQIGPALAMEFRGFNVDHNRRAAMETKSEMKSAQAYAKLRALTGCDTEFNFGSTQQVAHLLYDIMGAVPLKKNVSGKKIDDRSTAEKNLKHVMLQHPIYEEVVEAMWAWKKPLNWINNFGSRNNFLLYEDRFIFGYDAAGTRSWRFSSQEHSFWTGRNAQNLNKRTRQMCVADEGKLLVSIDYSASDNWWVAYESGDQHYIDIMNDPRDTHCYHASHFFRKAYEEVLAGYKAKEAWVVDSIKGVRQNTKRVVHGANYLMQSYTMYMTLGHKETMAAAEQMGFDVSQLTSERAILKFIDLYLLTPYYQLYPELYKYITEKLPRLTQVNKNLIRCGGEEGPIWLVLGRTSDGEIQRKLAAFKGQGGTAYAINRSLKRIFKECDPAGVIGKLQNQAEEFELLAQTHDSITGQIKYENLHTAIPKVLTIMREPFTVNGKSFVVPVDAEVGITWDNGMVEYRPDLTLEEIFEAEREFSKKNYPELPVRV